METSLRKNEKCFIGMPACGYVYESAKLCFVACPSHDKYILKIDVIKEMVEAQQYECHIALKRIDPGTFAFCTKICSKIIQSQFCIVFLDPSFDIHDTEYPNPKEAHSASLHSHLSSWSLGNTNKKRKTKNENQAIEY